MGFPPFWFVKNDVDIAYEFDQALAQDAGLGVLNDHDLMTAWHDPRDTSGDLDAP